MLEDGVNKTLDLPAVYNVLHVTVEEGGDHIKLDNDEFSANRQR